MSQTSNRRVSPWIRPWARDFSTPGFSMNKIDSKITFDNLDRVTKQILIGSLLGDGSISVTNQKTKRCVFAEGHGDPQLDYLYWKKEKLEILKPSLKNVDKKSITGIQTPSHPMFYDLREKFYPSFKKCRKTLVPTDIISQIDYLGLLVYFLDDGSILKRENKKSHESVITARRFTQENRTILVDCINQALNLKLTSRKCGYIGIPPDDIYKLIPIFQKLSVEHNIPKCMQYKLITSFNIEEKISINGTEALGRIKRIQNGSGLKRKNFPTQWKAELARDYWCNGIFNLGMEYGYLLAMSDIANKTDSTEGESDEF
jgi:hypothetical protein